MPRQAPSTTEPGRIGEETSIGRFVDGASGTGLMRAFAQSRKAADHRRRARCLSERTGAIDKGEQPHKNVAVMTMMN
jgi:hypothetical protein